MATLLHQTEIAWAQPHATDYPASEARHLEAELKERIEGEVRLYDNAAALSAAPVIRIITLAGVHMPPGSPDWRLPPPETPMIWQGLSDRQLCELLKDPNQNGHRSIPQIVEHMSTPLVLWGWTPVRAAPPYP